MPELGKTMIELKLCPFCGNKAKLVPMGLDGWRVKCCKLGYGKGCCTTGDSIMDKKEHIKLWNTRFEEKDNDKVE